MKLANRLAIITGASRGLGKAIARQFVREGASVLLVARSTRPLQEAETEARAARRGGGRQGLSHVGDVSDPERCAAIAERAIGAFGSLTAPVKNASIQGMVGRIEDFPREDRARRSG